MAVTAYYNEFDPYAAQWLRNLIAEGLIADGHVDERSIVEVSADDLAGYRQCHFFAGIGGWSLALRLAGWPDDRPVWTGSCPCQPFSSAGKQRGTDDERHLWPEFRRLIEKCRPPVVFGEQVASKAGRDWFAAVRADLEGMAYAVGGADLCAAGCGAPHIRQRLWFVGLADADDAGSQGWSGVRERADECAAGAGGLVERVADADRGQCQGVKSVEGMSATGKMPDGRKVAVALPHVAKMTGWPTPVVNDETGSGYCYGKTKPDGSRPKFLKLSGAAVLAGPMRYTADGRLLTGSTAVMTGGGQLNPAHSRWLMGYPAAWDSCGATAMQSFQRSRRSSSER